MAKAEWGLKRTCQACGARFYDMQKSPINCPKCGAEFDPVALFRPRRRGAAAAAEAIKAVPVPEEPIAAEAVEEGLEPVEAEAEEEEVIEDASELGEDEDDVSEVIENVDENEER